MDIKELKEKLETLYENISDKKLVYAFEILKELIGLTKSADFKIQFEQNYETYKYLIKYTIEGIKDPERDNVHNKLIIKLFDLTDRIKYHFYITHLETSDNNLRSEQKESQKVDVSSLIKTIEQLTVMQKDYEELDRPSNFELFKERDEIIIKLFNRIWLSDVLHDDEVHIINKACNSNIFYWFEKSLIVSALTLSFLRSFDIRKAELLFNFIVKHEHQIWQRALVGAILCLNHYYKRLGYYTEIKDYLQPVSELTSINKFVEIILIQFIKSKETEKISKKLREEIIPQVAKITPKLTKKLDLDNIVKFDFSDEKNPEWERVFEDTPDLFKKLEELSKMQMEGSDIFMGTFALLKHFDFFKSTNHWFVPFYSNNQYITDVLKVEEKHVNVDKFLKALNSNPYLCNSDKYSFVFNLIYMPPQQKSILSELFINELMTMNEISDSDEKIDIIQKDKFIFTQYIQDLYRFFKLYPVKNLFEDVFSEKLEFINFSLFNILVRDNKKLNRTIADFYFDKNYFDEALNIFLDLNQNGLNDFEVYQKIGYCYQKLDNFESALDYYLKAELFDKNKVWNLKKIAHAFQRLKQPNKALEYYLEVEKLEPDNLQIQVNIGQCYLDMKDFETALKYYFKVEYLAPSNIKVMRPIAWCYFVLGKFENAKTYLNKVIDIEGNSYDYLLLGHIDLCLEHTNLATKSYLKSLNLMGNNFKDFYEEFTEDKINLINSGINENDLIVLLEYLRWNIREDI